MGCVYCYGEALVKAIRRRSQVIGLKTKAINWWYLSWEGSVCVNCMAEEGIDPAEMNGKCRPSVLRG